MSTKLNLNLPGKGGVRGTFSWLYAPTGITYYNSEPAYTTKPAVSTPITLYHNSYHDEAYIIPGGSKPTLKVWYPDNPYGYDIDMANGNWSIYAGNQEDNIHGSTPNTSMIDALGGSDTITASDANTVYGGQGNDEITVRNGNEIYSGRVSSASDSDINDPFDNDTIEANNNNKIYSGYGDDSIVVKTDNFVYAGAGNDQVRGNDHNYIDAGSGNDTV